MGLSTAAHASPPSIRTFRIDVSHRPHIGFVVAVPKSNGTLTRHDFTVILDGQRITPQLGRLSAHDLQIVLAPDTNVSPAVLAAERAAAAGFVAELGRGAQTAIVDPHRPEHVTPTLTRDPAQSALSIAHLTPGGARPAATRLAQALAAFTAGPQVRRTIVLTTDSNEPISAGVQSLLRRRLAASGTTLYVIDNSPHGATQLDRLADGSGGFTMHANGSGAFDLIRADLKSQYFLRVSNNQVLPTTAEIVVHTSVGVLHSAVELPKRNPAAPPVPAQPGDNSGRRWDSPFVWSAGALIVLGLSYGLGMLAASRRRPRNHPVVIPNAADELLFVFLLPCLNEEKVILASVERLVAISTDRSVVMVIDDGSDDHTADVVSGVLGGRVWLLRRTAPNARQGKGEALNAAIAELVGSGRLAEYDPANVIVAVVDADGRLEPGTIEQVTPYFADPSVGATQIGVRINNRHNSLLARMQDMEFVIYTEIFQRGRRHLGSVGLGGNGQFMRLSALLSLGIAPWTRSLTDDLDLGVRLLATGWRNEYCSTAAVHQQGVVELRRLIRQRSRWFQGHLQSWKLIPTVLRDVPRRARTDVLYHLTSPALLLIASLLSGSFLLALGNCVIDAALGRNPAGWWIASTYVLSFGPALAYSAVYRKCESGISRLHVIVLAHVYVCYGLMWYASGWWAVARTIRGRTGWAKTDRVVEPPAQQPIREKVLQ
jgi:cellulose synthase/poly-beta-1,6-N-acetylglucosamine synthase-like glycosyltransferase